jgi:hypothetical protein
MLYFYNNDTIKKKELKKKGFKKFRTLSKEEYDFQTISKVITLEIEKDRFYYHSFANSLCQGTKWVKFELGDSLFIPYTLIDETSGDGKEIIKYAQYVFTGKLTKK